ncbi:hypothetical protein [Aquirufa antheringensis]
MENTENKLGCKGWIGLFLLIGLIGSLLSSGDDSKTTEKKSVPQTNEEKVNELQNGYDGSFPSVVKFVKNSMNDPDSFEHVESRTGYYEKESFIVSMKYRGKNPFGGVITKYIDVKLDYSGNVISIEKDY